MQTSMLALLALLVLAAASPSPQYTGTVYMSTCEDDDWCAKFVAGVEDPTGAAYGMFEDGERAKADGGTGWGVLYINTNEQRELDDLVTMYAAGYLEAALTAQQIKYSIDDFQAQYFNSQPTPQNITDFATAHLAYLRQQVAAHPLNGYWHEVALLLSQLDGIMDGYNDNLPGNNTDPLTDVYLLILNMDGDLLSIMPALGFSPSSLSLTGGRFVHPHNPHVFSADHCSSLIRVLPNNTDLFVGHDTWSSFQSMIRIFKHYNLPLQSDGARDARRISFTSYPGFISSVDDWYVNNRGLVVTETTNDVFNMTLYQLITPVGVVMSFMRCMIATGLASSGPEWVEIFSKYNSGTYNNQWIILDLKLFKPNEVHLRDNLLTIAEQIPGYIHSGDVTDTLRQQGFWPSYNIPYFVDIWNVSGYPAMFAQHGNGYSYSKCPRAQIFHRDAGQVNSYDEYQRLMRYNRWQTDPLSNGDSGSSIMARADLNATNPSPNGGIDSKTTCWSRALHRMSVDAMSGPTHDDQVPFTWVGQWNQFVHEGMPDVFDFDPVEMAPDMYTPGSHASVL